jgi:hypothetical protein
MLLARIEGRIVHRHGHELWTGPRSSSGTPETWSHGHAYSVRRVRFEAVHGALGTNVMLQRTCNEARCVRVDHARAGRAVEVSLAVALRRQGLVLRAIGALLDVNVAAVHAWCRKVTNSGPLSGNDWRAQAACTGVATAAFFEPAYERAATALCQRCPVRDHCLAIGVETGSQGLWGGKVLGDRKPLR